ncbi:MAG TPA: protein kinase [Candidatus Ozemobacteraceae bacterium]|nr:protein kinase [Candidatus Ozemobacteraceae bacterium]
MIKPDQIVGRHYRILAQLGVGGMGQVYRAHDVNLGREVAIKFLLDADANEEIRQRFINEGRILATICHRAVISVYASDVDETLNVPFLVMEFVDGKPIDRLRDQYLANQTLLIEHFVELLEGIDACHQKGIIHRDIKPANILVNRDGQLKILDFGIAKTAKKQTKTGVALGTPHYMSPEQCLGKAEITAQADVYAIGVMFWEFLAGKLPFDAGSSAADPALAIALMHLHEPPPLDEIGKNPATSRFGSLLERMLAKKPTDRPTVSEVLDQLRRELSCSIPDHAATTGAMPAAGRKTGQTATAGMIGEIYRLQRELGTGGMGTVHLAVDTTLNRQVAIKVLNESLSSNESLVDRFIREGQLLATVGHPNIMNIYASGRDHATGRPFLVMEYIDGMSLSTLKPSLLQDRRSIPPLMLQLFEGIAACHAKGVIHRDLKPSNIMVTRSGLLKVLDFGIARVSTGMTQAGVVLGTPAYMAPEQCMGIPNLTPATDVYAMGVIFWELIFGELPFKPDNVQNAELSIAMKHVNETLPAIAIIPDEALAPLFPLIRRMLDKAPEARPTAPELIEALDRYIDEHLASTPAAPATRKKSRSLRTSGLRELIDSAGSETGSPLWRRLVAFGGGAALVAALWYGATLLGPDNTKLITVLETQLRQQIAAGNLDEAVRTLAMLEAEPEGRTAAAPWRSPLAEALSAKARVLNPVEQASPALYLYDLALSVDPTNATAAAAQAVIKTDLAARLARERARQRLLEEARALAGHAAPGSDTVELDLLLERLRAEGLGSDAAALDTLVETRFLRSGEAALASDPAQALAYFEALRLRSPELPGLAERIASAGTLIEEEKARLARSREAAELVARLDTELAGFSPTTDPATYLGLCDSLARIGEQGAAIRYRRDAAARLDRAAETALAAGNGSEAVALMKRAAAIHADLPGLNERLRRTEQRIAEERAAAEREARRQASLGDVTAFIGRLAPASAPEPVLDRIAAHESEFGISTATGQLRRSVFDLYLTTSRSVRDADPVQALELLRKAGRTGIEPQTIASETTALEALAAAQAKERERQKRIAAIREELPAMTKAPTTKAAARLPELLAELKDLGEARQAEEARHEALAAIRSAAAKLDGPTEAESLRSALKRLAPPGTPEEQELANAVDAGLASWRTQRRSNLEAALGKLKPAESVKPAAELLRELESLAGADAVRPHLETLKKAYLDAASRQKKPEQARALLAATSGIPGLKGNREIADALAALDTRIADEAKRAGEARRLEEEKRREAALREEAERRAREAAAASAAVKPPEPPAKPPVVTPPAQPPVVEPPAAPREPIVGPGGFATLAEAVAAAKPGQTIRVKPGTYRGSTHIDGKITIQGDGSRGSIILESGSGPVLTISGNALIAGLTIRFTGSSQTDAVRITGGSPTVRDCTVTSTAAAAAPAWSACIAVDGGSPTITGNTLSGSRGMGFLARGGSPRVSGNTLAGNAIYGAWFTDRAGGVFEGNTVSGSGKSGVGIKDGANPTISNNTISNNTENGIFVYQGGKGTIRGNTLSQNGWSGIQSGMGGTAAIIADNRITGNRKHGIHAHGDGSSAVVGANTLSGNAGDNEKAESGGRLIRR